VPLVMTNHAFALSDLMSVFHPLQTLVVW
jgi:hypothetical protein